MKKPYNRCWLSGKENRMGTWRVEITEVSKLEDNRVMVSGKLVEGERPQKGDRYQAGSFTGVVSDATSMGDVLGFMAAPTVVYGSGSSLSTTVSFVTEETDILSANSGTIVSGGSRDLEAAGVDVAETIQAVYSKDGLTATAWLPQRIVVMPDQDNQNLLRFLVTAIRIHSWVNVTLGRVQLRTISALMTGPFKSPELEGEPPMPFRDDDMVYPAGDQSFWQSLHVIGDDENDAIDDWHGKFLRAGLWHSAMLAGGTLVGYGDRLYIVPHDDLENLAARIKETGAEAFPKYDSFVDPSIEFTDAQGRIQEPTGDSPMHPASAGTSPTSRPDHFQDIAELAKTKMIAAIKLYRERTGVGLKDAKEAVEALRDGRPLPSSRVSELRPMGASSGGDAELLELLRTEGKIVAIKRRREQSGDGLKDAKDYVEALASKHGVEPAPSSSGCFIATAACGPTNPHITGLREYRDTVLSRHSVGRITMRLYARFSPPIARAIEKSEIARYLVRACIVIPLARLAQQRTANKRVESYNMGRADASHVEPHA
jgi:ribosomal protein L7/L12